MPRTCHNLIVCLLVIGYSVLPCLVANGQRNAASVNLTPSSLSFGNQTVGTTSAAKTIVLFNNQTKSLLITSITPTLSDFTVTPSSNCPINPKTLAAGASCSIFVTFSPKATGSRAGTLNVTDNGPKSPQQASLSGTGLAPALVSIAITPSPASIALGKTQQFTATGTYTDGTKKDLTTSVSWTSSATSIATISSAGLATSKSQGSTTITAASGTIKGSATLTVTPPALVSIAVTPLSASIALGKTQQFTATGTYTDNSTQNLTASATWTSSATSVATVSSAGLATSKGQGSTTVTATSGTIKGTATLTVTPPTLVSIAVSPLSASIALGQTQQFAATGTYTDSSTQNLTASVTWTSSATSVATVSSTGLATSRAQGNTTITATSSSISGSAGLTVTPPTLMSIVTSPSSPSIALGEAQQFTATGTYTDNSKQDLTSSVTWTSSATSVATINSAGQASSKGQGNTTITAALGAISGPSALTVTPPALVSLAVTPTNPSLALGTMQALTATGTYTDGSTLDVTTTVAWSSANPGTATVNAQGLVTSVAVGSTTVTATSGSVSGGTTVSVTPAVLVSIAVTPAIPSIALGMTQQFAATGTFTNGTTQDITASAQWSSDTAAVATISNSGLASSVGTGTANITATSGSVSGSTTLTVTAAVLESLAINPANPSIALGTKQAFTAQGTFSDNSLQDMTATVTWTSDTPGTATIDKTGLASGVGTGTANITATSGSVSGSTGLTVTAAQLVSIVITPATTSVPLGVPQQFTATGTYTDSTTQDLTQSGHWSSTNATVATISNTPGTQGLATALGTGTTTIGISSGAVNATATLTVNPAALQSIAITPQAPTIALGTSQPFTAAGSYTDGSTQDITATVTWSSSSATVAVISNGGGTAGTATSAGVGATSITATLGSVSSSTTLTVGQAALVSITVTPANPSLPAGTGQQFTATGTYTDGSQQDLTGSVTWWSDAPGIASVTSGGLATGLAIGVANINAASAAISGSSTLTVTPPALVNLNVTPPTASIPNGTMQAFTATGSYTDGSMQNLTSAVTWSSSVQAVATVNSSGMASGTGTGSAMITATLSSISASASLTVTPPALVSLAVTPTNPSLALGTMQALTATGTYTDGSTLDVTTTVAWSSANPGTATVNAQGLVTSVAVGSTTVTATSGSVSGGTTVSVTPAVLVSIAVTPAIPSIALGMTQQFAATGTFTNGTTQDITASAQWSSDTAAVATISNSGLASSVGTGTANITATSGSVSGSTTLTVTAAVLESLAINPANPSIALGTKQAFTAQGTFSDNSLQDMTATVTWTSDTPGTATIDKTGLASGVGTGTANITATSGSVSGSTGLTVTAAQLVSIVITPATTSVPLGVPQQFTATGTYTDSTTQDLTQSGHWSSTNATVATISNTPGTQGLATALGTGTTTIGISSGAVNATATLTVNPAALQSIAITPQAPTIALGTSQSFTAAGSYTDGSTQDITATVTWSSSSATVAVISNNTGTAGLATSAGVGATSISATLGSVSSSTTLTVGQAALVSITVTPANPSLPAGTGQQFTATGTYTDGSQQDLTGSVTWWSDAPGIASVTSGGLATGLAIGVANINAASGAIKGASSLTVTAPLLLSLTVSPSGFLIPIGSTQQFTAVGTYSDGSRIDITAAATWSSFSPQTANIGQGGLATAIGSGTTTVTALVNSTSANAVLTVSPPISSTFFGMHVKDLNNWPTANIGALAKGIGTAWNYLETARGVYKWGPLDNYVNAATNRGIDLIQTIHGVPQWAALPTALCTTSASSVQCSGPPANPQDLSDFVTTLVTRYAGRIKYYELWNEPNNKNSWNGTTQALVTQSQTLYSLIKSIDPNAIVLTPGPAANGNNPTQSVWMQQYLQAGGYQSADIGTWHAYPKTSPLPSTCPNVLDCAGSLLLGQASAMQSVFNANGMAGKPVVVSEGGWGLDTQLPDLTQEAAFVARWEILLASTPTNRTYWYGWSGLQWGSLADPSGIRPSGTAYQQVYNWLVGAGIGACSSSSNTWTCPIGRGNGYQALVVWNSAGIVSYTPGTQYLQYRDLSGNTTPINGAVTIGLAPILLENSTAH